MIKPAKILFIYGTILILLSGARICQAQSNLAEYLSISRDANKSYNQRDYEKAARLYRKAVEEAPNAENKYPLLLKLIESYKILGEEDLMLDVYMQIFTIGDDLQVRKAHENLGEYFYRKDDFSRAYSQYLFLSRLPEPGSSQRDIKYYYNILRLGKCAEEMGRFEEAKQNYMRLINTPASNQSRNALQSIISLYLKDHVTEEEMASLEEEHPELFQDFVFQLDLAMVYERQGNYQKVMETYERYLRDSVFSSSQTREYLFNLYEKLGITDQKMARFTEQINSPDAGINDFLFLGNLLLAAHKYNEAVDVFEKALATFPENETARRMKISTLRFTGRNKEAIAEYQNLLSKRPGDMNIIEELGNVYYQSGQREKAVQTWRKLTGIDGLGAGSFRRFGQILTNNNLITEAIEAYEDARKESNNKTVYSRELAQLYGITGQYEKAIGEIINDSIGLSGNDSIIISSIDKMVEDYPDSAAVVSEYFNNMVRTDPGKPLPYYILTKMAVNNQDIDRTISLLKQLETTGKRVDYLYYNYGQSLAASGDKTAAVKLWSHIQPDSAYYLRALTNTADAYESLGDYKNAAMAYQNIIDVASINSRYRTNALQALGELAVAGGNPKQAIDTLMKIKTSMLSRIDQGARLLELGRAYRRMDDLEKSEEFFNEVLNNYKDSSVAAEAQYEHAENLFLKGTLTGALIAYRQVVANYPGEPIANEALGRLFLFLATQNEEQILRQYSIALKSRYTGDHLRAAQQFKIIADRNPDKVVGQMAELELAEIEVSKGNSSLAAHYYRKFLNDHPDSQFGSIAAWRWAQMLTEDKKLLPQLIEVYELIIDKFPDSLEAKLARMNLSKMAVTF